MFLKYNYPEVVSHHNEGRSRRGSGVHYSLTDIDSSAYGVRSRLFIYCYTNVFLEEVTSGKIDRLTYCKGNKVWKGVFFCFIIGMISID